MIRRLDVVKEQVSNNTSKLDTVLEAIKKVYDHINIKEKVVSILQRANSVARVDSLMSPSSTLVMEGGPQKQGSNQSLLRKQTL
jgi:hypothetical protein